MVNPALLPALLVVGSLLAGCAPSRPGAGTRTRGGGRDTVSVRDVELERRLARLELRVLEKEAQVDELQTRLDDARDEVVSTMAKLRTLASRAEAASAMAEADVALQSLRGVDGARGLPEMAQATAFVQRSTVEFNRENYGGALYLANQAKAVATAGRNRLAVGSRGAPRSGETALAVPVRVRVAARGNVREGPGTNHPVAFEATAGTMLTAVSYTEDWIRVLDDGGRSGWIFRSLIFRP